MTTIALLVLSVLLNVVAIFYCIRAARKLNTVASNLEALYESVAIFQTHLQSIHELEMFYGDENLKSLIEHSKEVVDELEKYEDIYALVLEEEEELETEETEEN